MAATWEEIKKLASDFQRAQLSSTTQRLAERNCHEIVDKLISLGLIEVIYTSDGKSYLTPQELEKEIQEEVMVHAGRVNLVTIQQSINVNMNHIESKTHQIVADDPETQFVLGQIIHSSYLDQMARDVNDQLQDLGQVTFAMLTKDYDLPGDFIKKEMGSRVGELIFGKINPSNTDVLYTDSYISRHKARIRGIFSAVTRPTSVTNVMNRYNIPEVLLYDLLEELISSRRLKGTLSGNKTTYTPDIYSDAQSTWVKNFYNQNGYLEFDSVTRLGIPDAKVYIKKLFSNSAIMLNACCVSENCLENLDVAIEECLSANSYVDAMSILPSVVSPMDGAQLVQMSIKSHKTAVLLADTIVTTQEFINKCAAPFEEIMNQKAKKDMKMNASVFTDSSDKRNLLGAGDDSGSKKDERKKKAAATSKSGGGTQGREVKSKAVKSKFKRGGAKGGDSDDEDMTSSASSSSHGQKMLNFLSVEDIVDVIEKLPEMEECIDVMKEEIAQRLHRPLRDKYQEVAKSMFMESSTAHTPGGANKRKKQAELEEKINALYSNIKLFEKSIKVIHEDEDLQTNLAKYLLKTLCSEVLNAALTSLATDHMITVTADTLENVEGRAKIISNLPDPVKVVASKVHTALNGKSLDTFDDALLALLSPKYVGILLKKPDKKRDRQIQFNHRMTVLEQLKTDSTSSDSDMDAATTFHHCVVLLFGAVNQTMLHCTGRLIPQIVRQLRPHLSGDNYKVLTSCQDLIIQQVKGTIDADDDRLSESLKQAKELASTLKKSETASA